MSDLHKLELRTRFPGKRLAAGNAEILLDGQPLDGVISVSFEIAVDRVAKATIVLQVAEVKADGLEVEIDP